MKSSSLFLFFFSILDTSSYAAEKISFPELWEMVAQHSPSSQALHLQKEALKQLITTNRITTGQWEQAKAALPGPLFIIDQPRADVFTYRPNYFLVMLGSFLGAFFFSIFLVLVQQRYKLS
jgi:hypothetical protein